MLSKYIAAFSKLFWNLTFVLPVLPKNNLWQNSSAHMKHSVPHYSIII